MTGEGDNTLARVAGGIHPQQDGRGGKGEREREREREKEHPGRRDEERREERGERNDREGEIEERDMTVGHTTRPSQDGRTVTTRWSGWSRRGKGRRQGQEGEMGHARVQQVSQYGGATGMGNVRHIFHMSCSYRSPLPPMQDHCAHLLQESALDPTAEGGRGDRRRFPMPDQQEET